MYHREIYAHVSDLIRLRRAGGEYRLLDLGCGNARYVAPVLKQFPPARYRGVDLSEAALAEARSLLAQLPCEVVLSHGDLLEAAERSQDTWDVIFSGFAIHHLAREDKARLFQAAARCLSATGWLLIVDVVRENRQSREDYLAAYLRFMREQWTQIPGDELAGACEHVATYDYPESIETLQKMAQAAGLEFCRVVSQFGPHCTMLFSRKALS